MQTHYTTVSMFSKNRPFADSDFHAVEVGPSTLLAHDGRRITDD